MRIGRYAIHGAIASGGMASVHFGRLTGPGGFARTVAVKRMHPHLAKDGEFATMFVDEARLAARVRHPNVVATLDVLAASDELLIVMEYVHGESLAELCRLAGTRKARIPPAVAGAIISDVLAGLHAAHESTDEQGRSLGLVHRDVSPANILVGADGIARLADFGVAKAAGRLQVTREGQVKGKIAYMAPEQVRGQSVGRGADIYGASVVLWELLTGRRLFEGQRDAQVIEKILYGNIDAPAAIASSVPEPINAVVLRGLAREAPARFATAQEMMQAVALAVPPASASDVSDWIESLAGDTLAERMTALARIERFGSPVDTNGSASASPDDVATAPRASADPAAHVEPVAVGADARIGRFVLLAVVLLGMASSAALVWRRRSAIPLQRVAVLAAVPGPGSDSGSPDAALVSPVTPAVVESSDRAPETIGAASSAATSEHVGGSSDAHPRRLPAGNARPPNRADCDPPYTTDADGTRHYKLRCL
jgi:serine/threonine-protein kinase